MLPSERGAEGIAARLEAAIAAANAEAAAGGPPEDRQEPAAPPASERQEATPEPAADDDEPNPNLPNLTKGQTRKLFEQWEAERKPRFFEEAQQQIQQANAEAERLRQEAYQRQQAEQAAREGYEQWYGPDHAYQQAEALYDQIVAKVQRGEYVPDAEVNAAHQFVRWRDNRRHAGTVRQTELGRVMQNVHNLFQQAKIEGVDVPKLLEDVSARGGSPTQVLEGLARIMRERADQEAADWRGKYEAEKAAHDTTRLKTGLGRIASGESGGKAPTKADLSLGFGQLKIGQKRPDLEEFVERASRGELTGLDLRD